MNPETVIDEAKKLATKKDSYTFIRQIGRGAFGTVFLAKDHNGHQVAIKIIKARASLGEFVLGKKPSQVKEGRQEAHMLFGLRHDNIVEIVETYEFKHFLTRGLAIVTEYYAHGSLEQCLKSLMQPPDVKKRLEWYEQLAAGLAFIHMKDIAHRDLKPANILVDSNDNLKIGDVGLAKAIWDMQGFEQLDKETTFEKYMSSVAGSPVYMAPEVWVGRYSITCDVFSIGLVYAMIVECPDPLIPNVRYSNKEYVYGLGWLLSVEEPPRSERATDLLYPPIRTARNDEKDLLEKMLCYDVHSRPTMSEVGEEIQTIRKTYIAEQTRVRRRPPPPVPSSRRQQPMTETSTKIPMFTAAMFVLIVMCYVLHRYDLLVPVLSGLLVVGTIGAIIGILIMTIFTVILMDCLKKFFNELIQSLLRTRQNQPTATNK